MINSVGKLHVQCSVIHGVFKTKKLNTPLMMRDSSLSACLRFLMNKSFGSSAKRICVCVEDFLLFVSWYWHWDARACVYLISYVGG